MCVHLAVHPAQSPLLNDEVTGRLQEVRAEVALLDVIVLIAAVSRPGPGPDRQKCTENQLLAFVKVFQHKQTCQKFL